MHEIATSALEMLDVVSETLDYLKGAGTAEVCCVSESASKYRIVAFSGRATQLCPVRKKPRNGK